ncbi:MAG: ATPase [Methanoculleaceae archaeon]
MKTEVLQRIKEAEDEYRRSIDEAMKRRGERIAAAEMEAEQIVAKARSDTEEYRRERLAEAREEARRQYEQIVQEGEMEAAGIRERGRTNMDRAVQKLVESFMEHLDVKA